jgi:hypothetical protein
MKQVLAFSRVWKPYGGEFVLDEVTPGFLRGAKIGAGWLWFEGDFAARARNKAGRHGR